MHEALSTNPNALESYVKRTWLELEAVDSDSVIEALKSAGAKIHTFSGNGGCDVSTSVLIDSVKRHGARKGSSEYLFMQMGMGLGHEVAIIDQFGKVIMVKLAINDLPEPGKSLIPITLNTFDSEGNQVDTTTMDVRQESLSDIVDHATQLVLVMRDLGAQKDGIEAFDQVFSELEKAIVSADIVEKSYAPLPTLLLAENGKSGR